MSVTMKTMTAVIGALFLATAAQAAHPDPAKVVPTAAKNTSARLVEPTVHPGGRHDVSSHLAALRAQADKDRAAQRR